MAQDEPAESLRGGGQSHASACQHNTVVSNKEIKRVSVTDSGNAGSCAPHTLVVVREETCIIEKGLRGGLEWISLILTSRGRQKRKAMT